MIPADYALTRAQWVFEVSTGHRFWACNCGAQPHNRTLRYVAANRHLFSLEPPHPPVATPNELANGAKL